MNCCGASKPTPRAPGLTAGPSTSRPSTSLPSTLTGPGSRQRCKICGRGVPPNSPNPLKAPLLTLDSNRSMRWCVPRASIRATRTGTFPWRSSALLGRATWDAGGHGITSRVLPGRPKPPTATPARGTARPPTRSSWSATPTILPLPMRERRRWSANSLMRTCSRSKALGTPPSAIPAPVSRSTRAATSSTGSCRRRGLCAHRTTRRSGRATEWWANGRTHVDGCPTSLRRSDWISSSTVERCWDRSDTAWRRPASAAARLPDPERWELRGQPPRQRRVHRGGLLLRHPVPGGDHDLREIAAIAAHRLGQARGDGLAHVIVFRVQKEHGNRDRAAVGGAPGELHVARAVHVPGVGPEDPVGLERGRVPLEILLGEQSRVERHLGRAPGPGEPAAVSSHPRRPHRLALASGTALPEQRLDRAPHVGLEGGARAI